MAASSESQPRESTDGRNDETIDEENAPLIHSSDQDEIPQTQDSAVKPPKSSFPSARTIHVTTILALCLSVLTLLSILAFVIFDSIRSNPYSFHWNVEEGIKSIIAPTIISLILSSYNIFRSRYKTPRSHAPNLLSLIIDLVVFFVAIFNCPRGLGGRPGYCPQIWDGPTEDYGRYRYHDDENCLRHWAIAGHVIAPLALAFGLSLGFFHLFLAVARAVLLFRSSSKLRKRGGWKSWSLPTGRFTFEVNFSLFKEPQGQIQLPLEPQPQQPQSVQA